MSVALSILLISMLSFSKWTVLISFGIFKIMHDKQDRRQFMICCILLFLSTSWPFKNPYHLVSIDQVNAYNYKIKGLGYQGYLKTEQSYVLSEVLLMKASYQKDPSIKQVRSIGTVSDYQVLKSFKLPSLKRFVAKNNPKTYEKLYRRDNESLIVSFSLPLSGLLLVYNKLSQRYFGHQKYERCLHHLYGLFFHRPLYWWYKLTRFLKLDRSQTIIVLVILFPQAYQNPFFVFVFMRTILSSLSFHYQDINPQLLRIHSSLLLFSRFEAFFYLAYPFLKTIYGVRFMLLFSSIFLPFINFFIDGLDVLLNFIFRNPFVLRFTVYGKESLVLFFIFTLLKNQKHQYVYTLFVMVYLTYPPYASVQFIDVGQGDSTLITLPFNMRSYLFDTGRAFAKGRVIDVIHQQGLSKLDYLIISHDDLDHNENEDDLVSLFAIETVIKKKQPSIDFMSVLLYDKQYEGDNENSLILYFNLYGLNYLLSGDAHCEQEQDILKKYPNLLIDVLKLGHHGSKTSTDPKLLLQSKPRFGIISSQPSIYNHPHPDVLRNLFIYGVKPLQTSEWGHIKIFSLPWFHIIKTSKGGFDIIRIGDRHVTNNSGE